MKMRWLIVLVCCMGYYKLYGDLGVTYEGTTLSRIKKSPGAYNNMGIKIKVIFNTITEYWAPVFTFFSSEKFINFAVWGYEQKIWFKKSLLNDYPYFYVRKDTKEAKKIIKTKKFECLYLKGVVRNVYNNKAWIEVEEIKSNVFPCISEEILSLAIKANESFKEDNFIETIYFAEKLERMVLLPALEKRTKEIKCFSYLQLNLKKQSLECYKKLFSLTGDKKYKIIIDSLKKELKKKGNGDKALHMLKEIRYIVKRKNKQIEQLKKQIRKLKNLISESNNIKMGIIPKPFISIQFGHDINANQVKISNDCRNNINKYYVRRIVERRLDREEVLELITLKNKCQNLKKEVDETGARFFNLIKPKLGSKISEDKKEKKPIKFFRRIVERRLNREEFEYLIARAKEQL